MHGIIVIIGDNVVIVVIINTIIFTIMIRSYNGAVQLSCRYYAIVQPLDYPLIMTHRRVGVMLIIVWLAPALLSFLPICSGWYTTSDNWHYLKTNPHVSHLFLLSIKHHYQHCSLLNTNNDLKIV